MIPPRVLAVVLHRSHGMCEVCCAVGTQTHHRRPRGMGGSTDPVTNTPANLLRVCGAGSATGCHFLIETNRARSYNLGLLIRRHVPPTDVPVLLRHGWVFLNDEGNYLPAERATA